MSETEKNDNSEKKCCCKLITDVQKKPYYERFYQRIWRPMMAFLYMILNIVDYIIRPAINYYYMSTFDLVETLLKIKDIDTSIQLKILDILSNGGTIPPIIPEFVHLSFGAILGVAAFSRYQEKKIMMNS